VERSSVSSPTSYLDAIRQGPQLQTLPLLEHAKPCLIVGGSHGNAAAEQGKRPLAEGARHANVAGGAHDSATGAGTMHERRNRRSRRPRPRPKLVHGLPARPMMVASPPGSALDVADGTLPANASML
jgi:hypothetical protein